MGKITYNNITTQCPSHSTFEETKGPPACIRAPRRGAWQKGEQRNTGSLSWPSTALERLPADSAHTATRTDKVIWAKKKVVIITTAGRLPA